MDLIVQDRPSGNVRPRGRGRGPERLWTCERFWTRETQGVNVTLHSQAPGNPRSRWPNLYDDWPFVCENHSDDARDVPLLEENTL